MQQQFRQAFVIQRECIVILLALSLLPGLCHAAQGLPNHLRPVIESDLAAGPSRVTLQAKTALQRFYTRRDFAPVWWTDGNLRPVAREFLRAIADSATHGLNPADYHHAYLEEAVLRRTAPVTETVQANIEAALTDAWFLLAGHYLAGKVDPERIDADWTPSRRNIDIVERLEFAVNTDTLTGTLLALPPAQPEYRRLRELLARLREQADEDGAAAPVPAGPTLRRDDSGPRVLALRARLLPADPDRPANAVFDADLEDAVRRFQADAGLEADGVVGPATLRMLNLGSGAKIDQVLVNLERLRWMPDDLGERHVSINIADFSLSIHEGGAVIDSMKVIVGRSYRRTPVFSDAIRYLVFNPDWEVPTSIATRDILPSLRKNPAPMAAKGFVALDGQREIDVRVIDWNTRKGIAPYRLRQRAGPANALGRVKIMFPNKYSVYLHDTADRSLFDKGVRTFSSGCIRVSDPLRLSAWLLQENTNWDLQAVRETIGRNTMQTVWLARPVPVHLQYLTAWVDAAGTAYFRDDIYQRDRAVLEALKQTEKKGTEAFFSAYYLGLPRRT